MKCSCKKLVMLLTERTQRKMNMTLSQVLSFMHPAAMRPSHLVGVANVYAYTPSIQKSAWNEHNCFFLKTCVRTMLVYYVNPKVVVGNGSPVF